MLTQKQVDQLSCREKDTFNRNAIPPVCPAIERQSEILALLETIADQRIEIAELRETQHAATHWEYDLSKAIHLDIVIGVTSHNEVSNVLFDKDAHEWYYADTYYEHNSREVMDVIAFAAINLPENTQPAKDTTCEKETTA